MNTEECISLLEKMGIDFEKIYSEIIDNSEEWYPSDLITIISNMLSGFKPKGEIIKKDGIAVVEFEGENPYYLQVDTKDETKYKINLVHKSKNLITSINNSSLLEIFFYKEPAEIKEQFGNNIITGEVAFLYSNPIIDDGLLIRKNIVGIFGVNDYHYNLNNGVYVEYSIHNRDITNKVADQVSRQPIMYSTDMIDTIITNMELSSYDSLCKIYSTHSYPSINNPILCYNLNMNTLEYEEQEIKYKNTESVPVSSNSQFNYFYETQGYSTITRPVNYNTEENDLVRYLENFIEGEKVLDDLKEEFSSGKNFTK